MNQTTIKSAPLISANTEPQKFIQSMSKIRKNTRMASIVAIICGLVFIIIGFSMTEDLTPYSSDMDKLAAFFGFGLGVLSLLFGLVAPSFLKKVLLRIAQNQQMYVYEDHIEGRATRISGSTQTQMDFYETYDKINSVSTTETHISINLKDGNAVRCIALNAQELATIIRTKL